MIENKNKKEENILEIFKIDKDNFFNKNLKKILTFQVGKVEKFTNANFNDTIT